MKEKKLQVFIGILLIVIIILLAVLIFMYAKGNENANDVAKASDQNQDGKILEGNDIGKNNEDTKVYTDEEILINHLVESLGEYADKSSILKSIDGDVTAPKLTKAELVANKDSYKQKLQGILNNNEIIKEKYVKNNKTYYVYNINKAFNLLGVGTHMGSGVGITDANGMKLYCIPDGEVAKASSSVVTNFDQIVLNFGYDKELFLDNVIELIGKHADKKVILKATDGNVTAPKLTRDEVISNKATYKKLINEYMNTLGRGTNLYLENSTLNCKYNFGQLLNSLGVGTHMGAGLDTDSEGNVAFSW